MNAGPTMSSLAILNAEGYMRLLTIVLLTAFLTPVVIALFSVLHDLLTLDCLSAPKQPSLVNVEKEN